MKLNMVFSVFYWLRYHHVLVFRYWGFDGGPVLSVWLALDDSLEDNGALQVIPGTNTVLCATMSGL